MRDNIPATFQKIYQLIIVFPLRKTMLYLKAHLIQFLVYLRSVYLYASYGMRLVIFDTNAIYMKYNIHMYMPQQNKNNKHNIYKMLANYFCECTHNIRRKQS